MSDMQLNIDLLWKYHSDERIRYFDRFRLGPGKSRLSLTISNYEENLGMKSIIRRLQIIRILVACNVDNISR